VGPFGSGRSSKEKIDDMAKIIKELSNKISRMELDQAKPDPFSRRDFKRNPNPQIQQRQMKNEDQNIKTPFKTKNFMQSDDMQDYEGLDEDINNLSDDDREPHLTRQGYKRYLEQELLFGNEESLNNLGESDYHGIANSIMAELQHKYNLRPRAKNYATAPPKKILSRSKMNEATQPSTETQATKTKTTEMHAAKTRTTETKEMQTNRPERREIEIPTREAEKTIRSFNPENEINKIKILVPLVELAKNPMYRKQIAKMINFSDAESHANDINLEDDRPTIMFDLHIENAKDYVAPFYIMLTVHDHLLHKCMLDSGVSHNVMPKFIMEKLGLDIIIPYQDLYSFDSSKVKCLGMFKDLVVNLAQIPGKRILMDVVIVDVPTKYGMLLSRSWGAKFRGSLQLDMTYALIPIFVE
jgi:hypothetical protein